MEGNTHKERCQRLTDVSTYKERFEGLITLMYKHRESQGFMHTCSCGKPQFVQTYAETGDWPGASLLYSMKEEVLSCRKKSRSRAWEKSARRSRAEVIGKKAGQMFIEYNDANLFTPV